MYKELILKISDHEEEIISIVFSEEQQSILRSFNEKSKRLFKASIFENKIPSKLTLNWDKERGLQFRMDYPNDETIALLLHYLRPFILQGCQLPQKLNNRKVEKPA